MLQYRHTIKSTSLLPYSGADFKQAPKEPIDAATYDAKCQEITADVAEKFAAMTGNHDQKDIELVDQSDCESGACPIR